MKCKQRDGNIDADNDNEDNDDDNDDTDDNQELEYVEWWSDSSKGEECVQ